MALPKVHIKRILYATDLSANAKHAFGYAVSLANLYEAQLVILHVLTEEADLEEKLVGYVGSEQWEKIRKQQLEDARNALIGKQKQSETIRRVLNHFCNCATQEIDGQNVIKDETLIKSGDPVDQIIAQIDETDCDMIVMGSHGQGTLVDKMIGSTAEKVLRRSRVPVIMVRVPKED
jgi:nucleotide-binding universal stress UspA family protein